MFQLELMCHLYHLLSSLSYTLDVTEVVIVAVILENVALLDLNAVLLVADRVLLTRGLGTVSIVHGVTTSLRSARRSLVDLSWAQLADSDSPAPADTHHVTLSAHPTVML